MGHVCLDIMNRPLRVLLIFLYLTLNACIPGPSTDISKDPQEQILGYQTLNKLPFKEAWYGAYALEEKIGYSHFKIEPSGENFVVSYDFVWRLRDMKEPVEKSGSGKALVRPDLTMIQFESNDREQDTEMNMTGRSEKNRFIVEYSRKQDKRTREYPIKGPIFHSSAIDLLPALRGLKEGEKHSFNIFNAAQLAFVNTDQQIWKVRGSAGPGGAVWKVQNNIGGSVVNVWLDKNGLSVLTKARNGDLITVLEDEAAAKKFLQQKTAGK